MSAGHRILTWYDKHGDYPYDATGEECLAKAALEILDERLVQGYLDYPPDAEDRAYEILEAEDGISAYQFLLDRNDHEYERVSLQETRRKEEEEE